MHAPDTYRWHPGADPVKAIWPLVPAFQQDEVISSWLLRCALAQGCEPSTLTADVRPGSRFWCFDTDRELSNEWLLALHKLTGLPVDVLEASTLMPLQQKMTGKAHFPKGVAAWFLCLGTRNRRRCGGLQYCPECFRDQAPHYLVQHRLAWHTACPIHSVGLLDHCECCHAPLCPQLIIPPETTLSRCHRCGYELKLAAPGIAVENAVKFQNATDDLFSGRLHSYGGRLLMLTEWLSLARWMLAVLRAAARAHGPRTERFFCEMGVRFDGMPPPKIGLPFEYLSPGDRASFLANVWNMIQVGPDRLINLAKDMDVRPSLLLPRTTSIPASLYELTSVLQAKRRRQPSSQDHSDTPRSLKSVLMRWHRLLRKFQR